MCGIAGYHGRVPVPLERADACLALMGRRGPDYRESRSWVTPGGTHTCLLHSRLSIIDLDARANQPMTVDGGWIVFNGELYNYIERSAELEREGVRLRTRSDTEVMLASLRHTGWDVLERCEGMWAFAVYDEERGSLALCRDRFGEKPLYVLRDNTGVYFGSEIKFIAALAGRRLEVNRDHLWRYLVNGYKALYKRPHAFFKDIEELPPATVLHLDSEVNATEQRYWQPSCALKDEMTFEEAVAGARSRLIRSMEIRLRADVPLAFCMSGGVDSSALISIAKRVFGYDVHGFTIVNTDARYEESDMVDLSVRELAVRHTAVPMTTTDFLSGLRQLIRYHDAPVYTITYYAQWLLMRSIAQAGYRISVSGTGADELFSGYYDHHLAYLQEVREDGALHARSLAAWQQHIRPIVRNPFLSDPDLFVRSSEFRDHIFLDAEGFAKYLRFEWNEPFSEARYTDSLLRNRMLNELFHESVPVILHEDDLNAMFFSIENRSPFLDRDLFDFCNTIPTRHLIRDGKAKAVLREAVRGIAPDAIVDNRRKVGFNAPILDFLDVQDPAVRDYLLNDSAIFDYVNRAKIEALIAKTDLPNSESKFLFYFLNCKMFLEEFGGQASLCPDRLQVA
jgi:asparagine synthase (glutamine-hydrolysing)